jgi:hypothetical protein
LPIQYHQFTADHPPDSESKQGVEWPPVLLRHALANIRTAEIAPDELEKLFNLAKTYSFML